MDEKTLPAIVAGWLSRSEMFGHLPEDDLLAVAGFCYETHFAEGDVLLTEGEPAEHVFVIAHGKVALEKRIQIGRHSTPRNATIGYVGPGAIAGFSTLSAPYIYSTSAVCVEPARAIVVDGAMLRHYLETHPAAGYVVMNYLAALIADRYRHSIDTLTSFLSIVSHELRSPLAAIENYLQTMLGGYTGELNPKQERYVKRCILRVTELRAQIGDVVDLARMRPEQIQTDFEWFDLGEVGTESIEDVRLAAAEKNIRLQIEPPPAFEPVIGSRRRMRQVMTNLLNNAIRYSPEGSTVRFQIWFEPEQVLIEVEDQGPGIPAEDLPHIFKEFFRASNVGETTGMGLGLSIAEKIVAAHAGEIRVKTPVDEATQTGTRFTVVIPRNLKTPEMHRREWNASQETTQG